MVTFSKAPCCSDAKSCLTLWLYLYTVECQAPLSSTVSQSLLKFMSIELVILCNHLIFDHQLLLLSSTFPSIRKNWRYSFLSFPMSHLFASGSQSIGTSTSASVLPMNSQGWFPLGLNVWSPCSPRDSQESSLRLHVESINSSALSLLYGPSLTSLHDYS